MHLHTESSLFCFFKFSLYSQLSFPFKSCFSPKFSGEALRTSLSEEEGAELALAAEHHKESQKSETGLCRAGAGKFLQKNSQIHQSAHQIHPLTSQTGIAAPVPKGPGAIRALRRGKGPTRIRNAKVTPKLIHDCTTAQSGTFTVGMFCIFYSFLSLKSVFRVI